MRKIWLGLIPFFLGLCLFQAPQRAHANLRFPTSGLGEFPMEALWRAYLIEYGGGAGLRHLINRPIVSLYDTNAIQGVLFSDFRYAGMAHEAGTRLTIARSEIQKAVLEDLRTYRRTTSPDAVMGTVNTTFRRIMGIDEAAFSNTRTLTFTFPEFGILPPSASVEVAAQRFLQASPQLQLATPQSIREAIESSRTLAGLSLQGANLEGLSLNLPRIGRGRLSVIDPRTPSIDFVEAHLNFTNLQAAAIEKARFINLEMKYSTLRRAELRASKWEGVTVESANLSGADLRDSRFRRSSSGTRRKVTFSNSDLSFVDFSNSEFEDVLFYNCVLTGAHFEGAVFRRVRFDYDVYTFQLQSPLEGVNFTNADMRGVDFEAVNMTGANFTGTDLRGATYLRQTTFPFLNTEYQDRGLISGDSLMTIGHHIRRRILGR